MRISKSLEWWG